MVTTKPAIASRTTMRRNQVGAPNRGAMVAVTWMTIQAATA